MSKPLAHINKIGAAAPPHDVHQAFSEFVRGSIDDPRTRRLFDRMSAKAGIDHRFSFLEPVTLPDGRITDKSGFYPPGQWPDTAARMALYEVFAPRLALLALESLGIDDERDRITHLIVASCTGFVAPGIDQLIVRAAGLNPSVERTVVGFMGCYAAVNSLRLAHHIVRSEPTARVLVVNVELCTLHFQQSSDVERLLSMLLFGDGCAAALVTADQTGIALHDFRAAAIEDSADAITWRIGQSGFDMLLDEFPALGRLDFFESALAFMAGFGLKAFLIAQSLNQIEKAYGANNAILDNCHVRVSFATNDERTAKRVSDALGTATELRAMKNYAGHRLSPWLGHLMVSRQETARALLTPGEVMQLPPEDELVLVSGCHPMRAKKALYYEDSQLKARVLPAPTLERPKSKPANNERPEQETWSAVVQAPTIAAGDTANGGIRREPELGEEQEIAPPPRLEPISEFDFAHGNRDSASLGAFQKTVRFTARQAVMDPADGLSL